MQRIFLVLTIFFFSGYSYAQDVFSASQARDRFVGNLKFEKDIIYIFCKGTLSKAGVIAKHFNWQDTTSTHIGIGYLEKGKLLIHHVTTTSTTGNAFKIETLEEFINADDLYSFQLWQINMSKKERKKVYSYCLKFSHKIVWFDYNFDLSDDTKLYCSEFCANLLSSVDPVKFKFSPRSKDISNTIFEMVLKKKELIYYPVDFFQSNPYFTQLASYVFKK